MGIIETMAARFRRDRKEIVDRNTLAAFLEGRAAFLSQKCVTEFCRVRAGVYWDKLFGEAAFQDALMNSCWLSFTPALTMLTEMTEGVLRPAAAENATALGTALASLAEEIRDRMDLPPQVDREAWAAQRGMAKDRLAHAALAAPRPVRMVPDPMARAVFEALPLHPRIVTNDSDYIFNNLRMNLLRAHEEFMTMVKPARVVADLVGGSQAMPRPGA